MFDYTNQEEKEEEDLYITLESIQELISEGLKKKEKREAKKAAEEELARIGFE